MCGIAGTYNINGVDQETLQQMGDLMQNRGPDDAGYLVQGPLGLVHRRLSIIDLEGGHQPITNEDNSLAIICNGELYNFREITSELKAKGHIFKTGSDTEVLLHLYEEYGENFLSKINGMYAGCIAHLDTGKMFIFRDRFGQKPLFYSFGMNGQFAFASGPASLRVLDWVPKNIDYTAVHDFLEYQCIPAPRSIYVGIKKLTPGSFAVWEHGNLTIKDYWQPKQATTFTGTYEDAVTQTRELVTRAVERRMVADVPLGAFLSGGMDSSIICAVAQKLNGGKLHTYSIGFPEKQYDEREYGQCVADHLGTEHHFLEVKPDNFSDLEKAVGFYEEPFADASMLPTCLLSQFSRQDITVSLSGDAADELFGGYYRYMVMNKLEKINKIPVKLRKSLIKALLKVLPPKAEERSFFGKLRRLVELGQFEGLERYLCLISRMPETVRYDLYNDDVTKNLCSYQGIGVLSRHYREQEIMADGISELDLKTYLPNDILVKVDRASMAHALEVRSPFLDVELAEFAMSLPFEFKQHGKIRKRILKDAFAGMLPDQIFSRPKMGFGLPVARWLRKEWKTQVEEILLNGKFCHDFLKRDKLEQMIKSHMNMTADWSYGLFAMLVFELWLQKQD